MAYIKQISFGCFAVLALILVGVLTWPVNALSAEQNDAIVQNCSNIKQSLQQLQRADSRTRAYLGSAYETISTRFITPLNVRMVRNNLTSTVLFRIQNDFSSAQAIFRDSYVDYMRELENLIATDCTRAPEDFYNKLISARNKREELRSVTKQLADLANEQYQTVEELRNTL